MKSLKLLIANGFLAVLNLLIYYEHGTAFNLFVSVFCTGGLVFIALMRE